MIDEIFARRIEEYGPLSEPERLCVLQEILQELALVSLSREGFFSKAEFHGGTSLRVFRGLDRFSEDLDFAMKAPEPGFEWVRYLERIRGDMRVRGIDVEVVDRSRLEKTVKKAFLKTDSLGAMIQGRIQSGGSPRKIRIKLEIDTNPPAGADVETTYLTFPEAAAITVQTLESCFATKVHALLCREYVKGRDWYDFMWYSSKGTGVNFRLLGNALQQVGPWSGKQTVVDRAWLAREMSRRIGEIDWKIAREDVRRFITVQRQGVLDLWSEHFFARQLEQLLAAWDRRT